LRGGKRAKERKDYPRYDERSVSLKQRRTDLLSDFVRGIMNDFEEKK
jgi:hypothetical protein